MWTVAADSDRDILFKLLCGCEYCFDVFFNAVSSGVSDNNPRKLVFFSKLVCFYGAEQLQINTVGNYLYLICDPDFVPQE
ncbi:hypothetical protein SAMN05216388_10565 [Halorientalis persicus]|uniref:Uncharacterized protein n=1 Tax=Halorientalis persicus TaxID=1367881 RepID=A0A1H8WEF8_9EURY|nr:hypothetical protein SAMN05216388_10565 [Halorientalis persicus]